jgi:serine/threonine protein kinase
VIRRGPSSKARVCAIVEGIARALSAAHKEEVWHLDLKPENIIVTDLNSADERITLIDFGIAGFKSAPDAVLKAGSPRYMAPEQQDHPSAQCDIYSLSLIAFELFTGHLPVNNRSIADQLPRELGRSTISALITCQSAQPSARFREVSQLVERLRGEQKKSAAGITGAAIVAP